MSGKADVEASPSDFRYTAQSDTVNIVAMRPAKSRLDETQIYSRFGKECQCKSDKPSHALPARADMEGDALLTLVRVEIRAASFPKWFELFFVFPAGSPRLN